MRRVLGLAAFRRLLVSLILNELASSTGIVALSLLVYRRTGSAIGSAGFFLCSQFGPALISPLFVARLDQRAVKRVLVSLYALEAIIFGVLAWLVGRFSLAPVLALTLVDGVLALTARVLARAAWTEFTSEAGLLREAQAAANTSNSIAFMVGPAIGGAVVAGGGTVAALLVNCGLFALIWLVIVTAPGLPPAEAEPTPSAGRLRTALSRVRSEPVLRRLLGFEAVAVVFFMLSIPVEVVFAEHTLQAGAAGYGALLSSWGAGAIVGSAVYARWRALPSRTTIVMGTFALAAGLGLIAAAPSIGVAVAGGVIGGVGNGIQFVAVRTAVQEAAPPEWLALVVSLNESILTAFPGIGIFLGGAITAVAGPRPALAAGAAGSLAIAVAMRLGLPRETRRESGQAPPPRQERPGNAAFLAADSSPL